MPQATSYAELRAMPREQLVRMYDQEAKRVTVGLDFILAEIARRDADDHEKAMGEINRDMHAMTKEMKLLTRVMTVLTAVAAVAAVVVLFQK
jgi:cytidylate kinase